MAKKEILNYSSLLPAKKRVKPQRKTTVEALSPAEGSRKKARRVGRGPSSGSGKTSGRGGKGQTARSGYSHKRGHEGGQLPLKLRVPKRGFRSKFKEVFQEVNLFRLEKAGLKGEVGPRELLAAGLIRNANRKIKILGTGEIKQALKITADAFSESARAKIGAAGGSCTERDLKADQKSAAKAG